MTRKSAPCTVPMMSTDGVRKNCRIVRRAVCAVVVSMPAPWAWAAGGVVRRSATTASRTAPSSRPVEVAVVDAVVMAISWSVVGPSGGVCGRVGLGGGLGRLAGQGEEDLVEGGTAEADVVDLEASLVEQSDDGGQLGRADCDRSRHPVGVVVGAGR